MAEGVQLKKKICLRRKEKPAEFTFTQYLKVKLLWQSNTDLDLCIFYTKKDGEAGGVFSSMFRQKKSDMGAQDKFPFMLHTGDKPEPAEGGESVEQINVFNLDEIDTANVIVLNYNGSGIPCGNVERLVVWSRNQVIQRTQLAVSLHA